MVKNLYEFFYYYRWTNGRLKLLFWQKKTKTLLAGLCTLACSSLSFNMIYQKYHKGKGVFVSILLNLFLGIIFFEIYRCKFYFKVFRKKDVCLTL